MTRLFALALAAALAALPASAQNYPDKPIHIIVPFTPGSATDVVARALAAVMSGCRGTIPVFDGRRRYDLSLSDLGDEENAELALAAAEAP
jgi:hypothetical protein